MRSMLKVYIGWIHSIQVDDVINLLAIRLSMVYKCMQNVYVVRCKMSFKMSRGISVKQLQPTPDTIHFWQQKL